MSLNISLLRPLDRRQHALAAVPHDGRRWPTSPCRLRPEAWRTRSVVECFLPLAVPSDAGLSSPWCVPSEAAAECRPRPAGPSGPSGPSDPSDLHELSSNDGGAMGQVGKGAREGDGVRYLRHNNNMK